MTPIVLVLHFMFIFTWAVVDGTPGIMKWTVIEEENKESSGYVVNHRTWTPKESTGHVINQMTYTPKDTLQYIQSHVIVMDVEPSPSPVQVGPETAAENALEKGFNTTEHAWQKWLCGKVAVFSACIRRMSKVKVDQEESDQEMANFSLQFRVQNNGIVIHNFTDSIIKHKDERGQVVGCAYVRPDVLHERFRTSNGCLANGSLKIDILNSGDVGIAEVDLMMNQIWITNLPYHGSITKTSSLMIEAEYCHPKCVLEVNGEPSDLVAVVFKNETETLSPSLKDGEKVIAFFAYLPVAEGESISRFTVYNPVSETTSSVTETTSSVKPTTSSTNAILMRSLLILVMCWIVL